MEHIKLEKIPMTYEEYRQTKQNPMSEEDFNEFEKYIDSIVNFDDEAFEAANKKRREEDRINGIDPMLDLKQLLTEWDAIGEIGKSLTEADKLWLNLKDEFKDELKKIFKVSKNREDFAERMEFLTKFNSTIQENIKESKKTK